MVRQLILAGADPNFENDLGMNALAFSDLKGPFPAVSAVLREYASQGSTGLMDSTGAGGSSESKSRSRIDTTESVKSVDL